MKMALLAECAPSRVLAVADHGDDHGDGHGDGHGGGHGDNHGNGHRDDHHGDDNGESNSCPDGKGVGSSTASLRAERSANGDGRVYHAAFVANDGRGGMCTGVVLVCVPHDQGHGGRCTDQGALYDSTVQCGEEHR